MFEKNKLCAISCCYYNTSEGDILYLFNFLFVLKYFYTLEKNIILYHHHLHNLSSIFFFLFFCNMKNFNVERKSPLLNTKKNFSLIVSFHLQNI